MLPLIAGSLLAASLFASRVEEDEDGDEDEVRRKLLGLGREPNHRRPRDGPTVLESLGVLAPGSLFTVNIGEDMVLRAFADKDDAICWANRQRKCDPHTEEIQVVEHVRVPVEIYDELLSCFGDYPLDGYEAFRAVGPYVSKVKTQPYWDYGVVWQWVLHEEDFNDWPYEKQVEYRKDRFEDMRPEAPLPAGTRLYAYVEDPDDYLEEIELQEADENETVLEGPIAVGDSEEGAPGEGAWLVTFVVEKDVPVRKIVSVDWSSNPVRNLETLSEILGAAADPRSPEFDADELAAAFANHRGENRGRDGRTVYGPEVLSIGTGPHDEAGGPPRYLFVHPFRSRYVSLKVDSVRKGP